jgi:G3E family GTPase
MIGQVLDRNDTLPPDQQVEAIMIETTGMADPSPVLQTFVASPRCMERCVVDGVITVVDSRNILQHLESAARVESDVNESVVQIAFADRIILNKMDLVTPQEAQKVIRAVRKINRASKVS